MVTQYAQFLIGNFGWRAAYVGLGLLTLMVAFPAVFLFIREPARQRPTRWRPRNLLLPKTGCPTSRCGRRLAAAGSG